MPFYDYKCETNGEVVRVMHSMSDKILTWGQLAEKAEIDMGDTPAETAVTKLISSPMVKRQKAQNSANAKAAVKPHRHHRGCLCGY